MKHAEVVWAVAQIGPATSKEIHEALDETDGDHYVTILDTWRTGLLLRRKREREGEGGQNPFEYALRPIEVDENPSGVETPGDRKQLGL